jgi:hypothetical protein
VSRRYREGTLVLETDFETADGAARVIDFMPPRDGGAPQLMRIGRGDGSGRSGAPTELSTAKRS